MFGKTEGVDKGSQRREGGGDKGVREGRVGKSTVEVAVKA